MNSSISSSDPLDGGAIDESGTPLLLPAALAMVLRIAAPAIAVSIAVLAVAWAWDRRHPLENPNVVESVIVAQQVERAQTLAAAEILIVGDSSALMGIDAAALEQLLGRRVESLATVAFVGPAGYAQLVRDFTARHHARVLIVLMSPTSLDLSEAGFSAYGYERVARNIPSRPRQSVFEAARSSLYIHVITQAVTLPLPGLYGRTYGWRADLAAWLRSHHGSLIDPNVLSAAVPLTFEIGEPVERRLPALRDAIAEAQPEHAYLALMPFAAAAISGDLDAHRRSVSIALATRLGLRPDEAVLPLPAWLPNDDFAVPTHLNRIGQRRYTEALAQVLQPRLQP